MGQLANAAYIGQRYGFTPTEPNKPANLDYLLTTHNRIRGTFYTTGDLQAVDTTAVDALVLRDVGWTNWAGNPTFISAFLVGNNLYTSSRGSNYVTIYNVADPVVNSQQSFRSQSGIGDYSSRSWVAKWKNYLINTYYFNQQSSYNIGLYWLDLNAALPGNGYLNSVVSTNMSSMCMFWNSTYLFYYDPNSNVIYSTTGSPNNLATVSGAPSNTFPQRNSPEAFFSSENSSYVYWNDTNNNVWTTTNWTNRTQIGTIYMMKVIIPSTGRVYALTSSSNNLIRTGLNNASWQNTNITLNSAYDSFGVWLANSVYFAGWNDGTTLRILRSTDGINFTQVFSINQSQNIKQVVWLDNKYQTFQFESTDGINWNVSRNPNTNIIYLGTTTSGYKIGLNSYSNYPQPLPVSSASNLQWFQN